MIASCRNITEDGVSCQTEKEARRGQTQDEEIRTQRKSSDCWPKSLIRNVSWIKWFEIVYVFKYFNVKWHLLLQMWFEIWRVQENARLELGWGVAERESKGKVFINCDDYVIWISMTRRGRRDREGQDLRRQSLGWDDKMIWNSKHPLYKVKRESLQNYISSYCPIFSDVCLWYDEQQEVKRFR